MINPKAAHTPHPFMISVIIPVLNEAEHLPRVLAHLSANSYPHEALVVDGGSTDDSVALAQAQGVRVIVSKKRQRAAQMNLGACEARGDILVFLHADTLLRKDSLEQVGAALSDKTVLGGAFARRFDTPSFFLNKVMSWFADSRGRLFSVYFGDQCMFVKTETFHQLSGFQNLDVCEDADFSLRLRKLGKTRLLTPPILTSSRRFERFGLVWSYCRDIGLLVQYRFKRSSRAHLKK